jgi:hypothetical protein
VYREGVSSTGADKAKPKFSPDDLAAMVSTLQVEMVGLKTRFAEAETRNASLEETVVNLAQENELLKRRLYGKDRADGDQRATAHAGRSAYRRKTVPKGAKCGRRQDSWQRGSGV